MAAEHPQWEIFEDKAGEFRIRLRSTNGRIVFTTESYTTRASAHRAIEDGERLILGRDVEIQDLTQED